MSPEQVTAALPRVRQSQRKVRVGMVISNKMTKTIVVRVSQLVRHPKYDRVMKQSTAFKVHDEANSAKIGDWVKIAETRPLSKDKRWRLVEILKRASAAPAVPGTEPQESRQKSQRVEPQRGPKEELA